MDDPLFFLFAILAGSSILSAFTPLGRNILGVILFPIEVLVKIIGLLKKRPDEPFPEDWGANCLDAAATIRIACDSEQIEDDSHEFDLNINGHSCPGCGKSISFNLEQDQVLLVDRNHGDESIQLLITEKLSRVKWSVMKVCLLFFPLPISMFVVYKLTADNIPAMLIGFGICLVLLGGVLAFGYSILDPDIDLLGNLQGGKIRNGVIVLVGPDTYAEVKSHPNAKPLITNAILKEDEDNMPLHRIVSFGGLSLKDQGIPDSTLILW